MAKRRSHHYHFRIINIFLMFAFLAVLLGGLIGLSQINNKIEHKVTVPSADAFSRLMTNVSVKVPDTDFVVSLSSAIGKTVDYGDVKNDPYAGYGTVTIIPDYVLEVAPKNFIAIFVINSGGSGEAFYLMHFVAGEVSYQMTDSVYLGDRIKLETLSVERENVIVTFLDHGPDQAMVDAPNVKVTKQFIFRDDRFQQEEK